MDSKVTHLIICFGILVSLVSNANSQNWQSVGDGFPFNSRSLHSFNGLLYSGLSVVNSDADPLWVWNGIAWDTIETVCSGGAIFGMANYQDKLITVGCENLQSWDGSNWTALESSGGASVYGVAIYDDDLIAIGLFDTIGSVSANGVGRWDGQYWTAMDTTIWSGSAIYCAVEYQGNLYVGGNMINTNLDIDRIGRWDGAQWHKVGNGIRGGIAWVNCFEVYQGDLYVGGRFAQTNGNPGPNIARWDGNQWLDVGGGIDLLNGSGCDVRDMVVYEGELYAVGTCQIAGGVIADRIAMWDGEQWCGFGDVFNNNISAIEVHQGELYIGGAFTTINDDTIYRVAKWVGGDFVDQCGTLSSIEDNEAEPAQLTISPNPTTSTTTITWKGQTHGNYQLQLFDAQGRHVAPPVTSKTSGEWELDMRGLAPGIYFGRLVVAEERPFGSVQGKGFKVVRE